MWDYQNPLHFHVVDRYLRRMGIERIQTRLRRVESFYFPWVAGTDHLPLPMCSEFFVSFTNEKVVYSKNNTTPALSRLSHLHHPNELVERSCTRLYVDAAHVVMFIYCSKWCMSSTKTPITSIYKVYIKRNCTGVNLRQGLLYFCFDITKVVACLMWGQSISDTRRLSRTAGCTKRIDLRKPTDFDYLRKAEYDNKFNV